MYYINFNIPCEFSRRLLLAKLLDECEHLAGRSTSASRHIVHNVPVNVTLQRNGEPIRFDVHADTFVAAKRPIQPATAAVSSEATAQAQLPDIFPLKATISLPQSNIYRLIDHYRKWMLIILMLRTFCLIRLSIRPAITTATVYQHPHTILLHCSAQQVANLHDSPVSDTQLEARSLLKAFAVAASSARLRFGADVGELPQPIVVQSVQTDGRRFQFGSLQLNTLRVDAPEGATNVWHSVPTLRLFDLCEYRAGQPVLTEYNRQVLKHLYAFYRNN